MVKKMSMDFTNNGSYGLQKLALPAPSGMFSNPSKISLGSTLVQCAELKQMLRRFQGLSTGCSSCGKAKK